MKQKKKEVRKKQEHYKRLIKDKIIRDITTLFQQQEEDYYKSKRVSSFWNNNYIEYESNGHKNSDLSVDEYLNNKTKSYTLRISSDTWKIQLKSAINFISSNYTEEEYVSNIKCIE